MCLGQLWTEAHVCGHLESVVEDECIKQVSVLEDDRVTALVTLELGTVLLDEGLSVQKPTFLATLPECSQVVIVDLVALGDSVALVRAASLVRGNAGCGARGVDDGVLCCVLQAVVARETHHPREADVPGLAVQHVVMQLAEANLKVRVILLAEVFSQLAIHLFDNVFGDYNGSRNDVRNPNLEFEGHIESTKSHLSTFIVPRCLLPLLFLEQHFFRSLALWWRRL